MTEYDDTDIEFPDGRNIDRQPTPDQQFINEAFIKKAQLAETDIKNYSISWIEMQTLSVGCQRIWKKLWNSAFDRSKILSLLGQKTFTQLESVIRLRIMMTINKVNYETFDLDNPVVVSLPMQTEWDFMHYLSRAENGYEIERQHKITMASESTQTQVIKDARTSNKPKSRFFGLLGG